MMQPLATHSDGTKGWDNGFDRRPTAPKVAAKNGWHLATEDAPSECEHLQFSSLLEVITKIYGNTRLLTHPYVIGVTGSVGKTTTVAFIEHLLSEANRNVVRFYSKRLTPLSVMCHYINRVEQGTEFVVMEYSAYLRDHVDVLSKILPPNLAFLTNIYETHMNPGMFESRADILSSKIRVKKPGTQAFVNASLENLSAEDIVDWNRFEVINPKVINLNLPPTPRSAELYTVGGIVAQQVGISRDLLDHAYSSFLPTEKRILLLQVDGRNIFYHGETSGGSRLWSWFETTNGEVPSLFIDELNFADEDPEGFKNLLSAVFSSDKTYVLDIPTNKSRLNIKANFLSISDFCQKLREAKGYIVYHKALSARYSNFDPYGYLRALVH
ncbi:hypothetical protein HY045_03085 [Candidatus Woesebacteria bacterium]|nr:hypothetical protein [Candidatus Woesebacteria bacterium]